MMDQEAIVARVEGEHAYVEVGAGGCGRCHETGGCQSGILGQMFSSKPRQFRLVNRIGAVPGDHVVVRVEEGATLRAALAIYILPLIFLLLGAVAGAELDGHRDASAAQGALAGFVFGVLAGLTFRKARIGKVAEPILVRRTTSFCLTKETCR